MNEFQVLCKSVTLLLLSGIVRKLDEKNVKQLSFLSFFFFTKEKKKEKGENDRNDSRLLRVKVQNSSAASVNLHHSQVIFKISIVLA